VETVRDLAYAEAWRESIERSRARRRRSRSLRSVLASVPLPLVASPVGILMFALLAAVVPTASDGLAGRAAAGGGGPRSAAVAQAGVPGLTTPGSGAAGVSPPPDCREVRRTDGYVNPVAGASLTPKRIDQGVDYSGFGTLTALGDGTVTVIAMSDTGWPGAFIEYQLSSGPAAGCYVFYAEGVIPAANLAVGQAVRAGQPIAAIIPGSASGIEIGWGAGIGTETYAAKVGEWSHTADSESIPTIAGKSFSWLIAALGGPPGKIMG